MCNCATSLKFLNQKLKKLKSPQIRELPRLKADAAAPRGAGRSVPHGDGGARGARRRQPRHYPHHPTLRAASRRHHQQGTSYLYLKRVFSRYFYRKKYYLYLSITFRWHCKYSWSRAVSHTNRYDENRVGSYLSLKVTRVLRFSVPSPNGGLSFGLLHWGYSLQGAKHCLIN